MIRDVVTDKCPPLHQVNQQGEIIPLNPGKVEYPFAKIEGEVRFVNLSAPHKQSLCFVDWTFWSMCTPNPTLSGRTKRPHT